jgi:hypothetical protein
VNSAKHTPGPWKVCQSSRFSRWYVKAVRASYIVAECGIAEGETGEHNARVIAAAPQMLELLQELVDIEGPLPGNAEWANKVKTVLAAATGAT